MLWTPNPSRASRRRGRVPGLPRKKPSGWGEHLPPNLRHAELTVRRLPESGIPQEVLETLRGGHLPRRSPHENMRRLNGSDRTRVVAKVEQYAEDPRSLANQVIQLAGSTYRRLRVGDYRVLFTIERSVPVVLVVLRVRHRREAYD